MKSRYTIQPIFAPFSGPLQLTSTKKEFEEENKNRRMSSNETEMKQCFYWKCDFLLPTLKPLRDFEYVVCSFRTVLLCLDFSYLISIYGSNWTMNKS